MLISRARCVPRRYAQMAGPRRCPLASGSLRSLLISMSFRSVIAFLLTSSLVANAQVRPPSAERPPSAPISAPREPGSELTITLLTMGVGEEVWEQFGHNALWFHVDRPGSVGGPVDVVYNWGIFDSRRP